MRGVAVTSVERDLDVPRGVLAEPPATLPTLLIRHLPADQTGIGTGMYNTLKTLAGSVAGAAFAAVMNRLLVDVPGARVASETAYVTVWASCGALALLGVSSGPRPEPGRAVVASPGSGRGHHGPTAPRAGVRSGVAEPELDVDFLVAGDAADLLDAEGPGQGLAEAFHRHGAALEFGRDGPGQHYAGYLGGRVFDDVVARPRGGARPLVALRDGLAAVGVEVVAEKVEDRVGVRCGAVAEHDLHEIPGGGRVLGGGCRS